jgi:hypothetical protein
MIKKFIIKTDPSLDEKSGTYFFDRTLEILSSDKRWRGYNFEYVGDKNSYNDPLNTPLTTAYDILIILLSRITKHKLLDETGAALVDQPTTDGSGKPIDFESTEFSYTFYASPNIIVIDETNWRTAHERLKIKKEDYESYVVHHEVGHAIGHNHLPIPDDVTKTYPIMYQATLGLPDVSRFLPYPNESDYII